ncbi:MAG: STAS domain-containing protein [Planctomycetota bacterium]|nr:STAS domain-containing protein [Planctomycetota bacterium]MDW8372840.1 STAS domain-containing protein [Planctomycetota bacterium]
MMPDMALQQIIAPQVRNGELHIVVSKDFDAGAAHREWAPQLLADFPGPYTAIIVDCSRCGLLSSTFFAGLMQLYHEYSARGARRFVLHHPDPRVVRNLSILRLHNLFEVVPRP